MDYFLGEIWVKYPDKFWRKSFSLKLHTVLIKADNEEHTKNKLGFHMDKVRSQIRLAKTSETKLEYYLIETI
jgi:hypothetical protein